MAPDRKKYQAAFYKKNKVRIKKRVSERRKEIYKDPIKALEYRKIRNVSTDRYRSNLKKTVISHYSPKLECIKCGFKDMRALSVDHVKGRGAAHRRKIKDLTKGGTNFYRWLKNHNYPLGYQILCMNCQFIKRDENHECANNKQ